MMSTLGRIGPPVMSPSGMRRNTIITFTIMCVERRLASVALRWHCDGLLPVKDNTILHRSV